MTLETLKLFKEGSSTGRIACGQTELPPRGDPTMLMQLFHADAKWPLGCCRRCCAGVMMRRSRLLRGHIPSQGKECDACTRPHTYPAMSQRGVLLSAWHRSGE